MEILEYFDEENENLIGTEERDIVHQKGLWHREVAVWVVNNRNEILLQKRSALKKQYPNKYAICAGHIDIGEQPIEAAIRELYEETGIKVIANELEMIGLFKNEQSNNNHYKYTYLIKTNKEINDMTMQEEEVSELKYITIKELEEMIANQDENLTFSKKYYAKIIIEKIKEMI